MLSLRSIGYARNLNEKAPYFMAKASFYTCDVPLLNVILLRDSLVSFKLQDMLDIHHEH